MDSEKYAHSSDVTVDVYQVGTSEHLEREESSEEEGFEAPAMGMRELKLVQVSGVGLYL